MTEPAPDDTAAPNMKPDTTLSGPLPTLTTSKSPDQVIASLQSLSKRGKLPEFQVLESHGTARRFSVLAFGSPYDRDLFGDIHAEGSGSRITFTSRLKRKMPTIMIATMIVSLWPGVWLTDSMLSTYFSWYPRQFWITCAWYLPLTLAAIPYLWKQYRSSELLTHAEAHETIEKIATAIEAR